jgi:hypothetical protein
MEPKIRDRMSEDYVVEIAPVLKGRLAKEDSALDIQEQQSRIDRNNAQRDRYGRPTAEKGERPVDPLDVEYKKLRNKKLREGSGGPGGKPGDKPDGRDLPAGEVAKIADLDAATKLIDNLWGAYEAKADEGYSGLSQWMPATKAKQYNDERRVAAQVIGGILEGGKLTEDDFKRYYGMLPDPSDGSERAQAKRDAIRSLISTRRGVQVTTLGGAGFNTGGLSGKTGKPAGDFDLGGVRMVSPSGKTGTMDPAEAAEAEKNGWRRAD